MNKEEYQELVLLSMYGELAEEEEKKLEKYLKANPELKREAEELLKFKKFVSANTPDVATDDGLRDARRRFRTTLRSELRTGSFFNRMNDQVKDFFSTPWKLAFGSTGVLALGMMIGYCSHPSLQVDNRMVFQPVGNEQAASRPSTEITNIRFIDSDASDGVIEFQFDAVAPMHMKGKIDDPEIQRVLSHALLNESNDGIRLQTVNAIAQQADKGKFGDVEVKKALLATVKIDPNPGVRREALRVLQQYRFDPEIRDALLFVLAKDPNSGMRVAAINALDLARIDGMTFDSSTVTALKTQIKKEENNYIRNRAANFVKEIYQ
ncbi:MAG: HEAT repeat domain-containing protein [Bacteroidota bacterium]|jgi:hypothetical protein